MNTTTKKPETPGKQEIVIHIDQEQYKVTRAEMTVRELLQLAGENPSETTLVRRHDNNDQEKLTNLDDIVQLKNGMHFVIFHNTPTTVS